MIHDVDKAVGKVLRCAMDWNETRGSAFSEKVKNRTAARLSIAVEEWIEATARKSTWNMKPTPGLTPPSASPRA